MEFDLVLAFHHSVPEYCDLRGALASVPGVTIVAGMAAVLLGIRGEGGGGAWVRIARGLEEEGVGTGLGFEGCVDLGIEDAGMDLRAARLAEVSGALCAAFCSGCCRGLCDGSRVIICGSSYRGPVGDQGMTPSDSMAPSRFNGSGPSASMAWPELAVLGWSLE